MYRSFTAEQYKIHLGFSDDYQVDGVLCYGTLYENRTINALKDTLDELKIEASLTTLPHEFLRFGRELKINNHTIWFMIGYGGAWISEYIHLACLFGSKKNILLGSCGGLRKGIRQGNFIIPESSYGEESSVRIYNHKSPVQFTDTKLSEKLKSILENNSVKVWRGPMVTCQAMIGETYQDIQQWSKQGYYGVEMEASTVIAVSNHFNVPVACSMYVGDNLIEEHNNLSNEYEKEADARHQNQKLQIKAALQILLD
jgi:purine-nucleoside phosphorylase